MTGDEWDSFMHDVSANAAAWYTATTGKVVAVPGQTAQEQQAVIQAQAANQAPLVTYVASNPSTLIVLGTLAIVAILILRT